MIPTDASYVVSVPPLAVATLTCSGPVQTLPQAVGPLYFPMNVKNYAGKDSVTGMAWHPNVRVWCHIPSTGRWEHFPPIQKGLFKSQIRIFLWFHICRQPFFF
jgi:hypothetical protein